MRQLTMEELEAVTGGGAGQSSLVDTDGDGIPDSPEIVVNAPLGHSAISSLGTLADWYLFFDLASSGYAIGEAYGGYAGLGYGVGTGNPISATELKNQIWEGLIEMYRNTGSLPDSNGVYIYGAAIP